MSNGPTQTDSASSQTSIGPSPFLQSPLMTAARGAERAFNFGEEGPNQQAGRDLIGQNLRGDFLMPGSNPFLQKTFETGADAIQNRLDSQFAGSGRNIGASIAPAKADLSSFASQLFGGNLQAERDRQQGSLGAVSEFDRINQLISRLGLLAPASGREVSSESRGISEKKSSPFDRFLDVVGVLTQ